MSGVQSPRARADLLAAGASIKGAARKFAIDYHALRRHWRNHVSAEARAAYIAGVGATKDQLEEIVADPADLLAGFHALRPNIRVQYDELNSTEVYDRFLTEAAAGKVSGDLVWS